MAALARDPRVRPFPAPQRRAGARGHAGGTRVSRPPRRGVLTLDDTLEQTLAEAWRRLSRGVVDRHSPFRTPTLATTGTDGGPAARIVVLRAVDAAARRIAVHTDRRAAKVAELGAVPQAALLFWDPAAQLQLRVTGHASLHVDDATADTAWAALHPGSRAVYAQPGHPGTPVDAPPPPPEGDGRGQFAVLMVQVVALEWLHLAPQGHRREGHRRARFAWTGDSLAATWLVP